MHSFSTTGETLLVTTAAERRRGAHAPGGAEGTSNLEQGLRLGSAPPPAPRPGRRGQASVHGGDEVQLLDQPGVSRSAGWVHEGRLGQGAMHRGDPGRARGAVVLVILAELRAARCQRGRQGRLEWQGAQEAGGNREPRASLCQFHPLQRRIAQRRARTSRPAST